MEMHDDREGLNQYSMFASPRRLDGREWNVKIEKRTDGMGRDKEAGDNAAMRSQKR